MKKTTYLQKTILTICIVLMTTMAWGQTRTGLTGAGTSENPWQIGSAADWHEFATNVDYWEGYLELSSDIVVSEIALGDGYTAFSGTFDGNNNILTFNYIAEDEYDVGIAPFYYLEGSTVINLTINGSIDAAGGWVAGLAVYNYAETIENVTIGLDINAAGQNWCGGFAYESTNVTYSNCVYNGRIVAGTQSCGFTVEGDETVIFSNCLFDPKEGSSIKSGKVFGTGESFATCYYTDNLGIAAQGTMVYKNATDFIGRRVAAFPEYCTRVDVVVTGVEHTYAENLLNHYDEVMENYNVTFDGNTPTLNDYDVYIEDVEGEPTKDVIFKGDYVLLITGNGDYTGSYRHHFYVIGEILSGGGTADNPYTIECGADWITFANAVNIGNTYNEKYISLEANILVTDMVGVWSENVSERKCFSGYFDGGDLTITFNYGSASAHTEEEVVAPFRYTDGANIHNLVVDGEIHTNVGKESGLIGINTRTITNRKTIVQYVTVDVDFYCYEDLWDAEGGGFAYDGSCVTFISCGYVGKITANNYHGGICGNADGNTIFTRCLFNPAEGGVYWAENIVYNNNGATISPEQCFYTLGNNQEESEQGTLVYVAPLPNEIIGKKLTTFNGKDIYKPVDVVISGVNKRYLYTGDEIAVAPTAVTFDGVNALANYCDWSITPSPVLEIGKYTFTVTAPKAGVASDYLGSVTQLVRVVEESDAGWTGLQALLSGSDERIDLTDDIIAGEADVCLVVENGPVTINLNGYTIDRGFYLGDEEWDTPVVGGQVLKVNKGVTVTINGPGKITGGYNKAASTVEHGENNDGGGIYNMGNLTLNNVTIEYNQCEKYSSGVSRTARGGGIYSGKNSTLIINNCEIKHNEAKGGGGGVYSEMAKVCEISGTTIRSNISQDKGGGVRVDATGTQHHVADGKSLASGAMIKDSEIENNTVVYHNAQSASNGGGVHLDAGQLNLTNCSIKQNSSSKYGGGIYMMNGTINAENCNISYNQSYDETNKFEGYGGGVCVLGGSFNINGGTITGNSSYMEDGGGIFVAAGKTLRVEGDLKVYGNWTYDDEYITEKHNTNVYLVGSNDLIHISGSIEGASIGVSKSGVTGQITSNLEGNGTTSNFISDNPDYQILPLTVNNKQEAKIGNPATWDDPTPAPGTNQIVITEPTIINTIVTESYEYTIVFEGDGCLIIGPDGVLQATIDNDDPLKLIIEEGGQVITKSAVKARVKKEIEEFSPTAPIDNWYLLSSPINSPLINSETNLITLQTTWDDPTIPSYDLYRFNEAVDLQWENYRSTSPVHEGFNVGSATSALENGRGYLYRNYYDQTITVDGDLGFGTIEYTLTNNGTNILKGFNLIGNPYSHNIKKGENMAISNKFLEEGYYVLNPTGCVWVPTEDGEIIPPFTGIVVKVNDLVASSEKLEISDKPASSSKDNSYSKDASDKIWFVVSNNTYEDKACAMFKQGHGLNKIAHLNEEAPMLYINYKGNDFAFADLNTDTKAFNLNFEAKNLSMYTLSCKANGEFSYLHIFDKVTGRDIDMLSEGEYTFIGSPGDSKDRFVVRLSETTTDENGNEIFAYQNGSDIIVNGDGELQVFDVMGRMISNQNINGVQMVEKPSQTGVYIFRLNDKTQKIVVR